MTIARADFDDPGLLTLLELHLAGMHANTQPRSAKRTVDCIADAYSQFLHLDLA